MFDFNSCTFLGYLDWIPLVDSSITIFSIARVAQELVTFHMTFAETLIHLVFLWLWSTAEHGSTLFICGRDSFRFDMAPFCILCDHDSYISFACWICLDIYGDHFYMELYVPKISFVWHLSLFQVPLFEPFGLGFSSLFILGFFLFIMYVGYRLAL